MKILALAVLLLASSISANAATAFWTGRMESVTTVTYQVGWNCEYNYAGNTFWRVFIGSCPANVEVQ